jgi:hypothetical protein
MKFTKFLFIFFILFAFFLQSCDTGVQSKGDSVSGNIIFADSSFSHSNGYYAVALYTNQHSPFISVPIKTIALDVNATKPIHYTMQWGGGGYYFNAVVWINNNAGTNTVPMVLGTYGCDTSHSCIYSTEISFPNYTGHNFDILCWADTTKKLN